VKPVNETAIRSRDTIRLLMTLVDDRRPGYTRHAEAVARLTYITGLELGLDPGAHKDLHLAALLHDVGVLRLPLPHSGSRWHLPPEERRIHETHPDAGARIAAILGLAPRVQDAVLGHHERWNGTGYPGGLRAEGIALEARILGVCDVHDSLLNGTDRVDCELRSQQEVFDHLRHEEGERYDQDVVDALQRAVALERELGALTGAFA
jgi:putative nucleotidyltransferase with HDIG domain